MTNFVYFVILGLTLAIPIGPVNIEVIKRAIKYGFWPAYLISVGAIFADLFYLLIIYFGLSLFLSIESVHIILLLLGIGILTYLGLESISEYFGKIEIESQPSVTKRNSFVAGFLLAFTNPLTIIWWLGVFSAVLSGSKNIILLNCLTILIGPLLWFFVLSLILTRTRHLISEKILKFLCLIAGVVLILFAFNLLYHLFVLIIT